MAESFPSLSRSIAGKVALVTGAASGIGRATARLFAAEGARVAIVDLGEERVAAVAEEIAVAGGTALALAVDVADSSAVEAAVERVRAELGPVDILVNNAGVSAHAAIDAGDFDSVWRRTFDVNLDAQARLVRLLLDDLTRGGTGRVVNVASTEGLGATADIPAYTASKHGVVGLTRSLAVSLGKRGVTVNCVCPGPIRTGMTARIPDEHKDRFARRRVPLRRYGEPEELAHAILHLVLPASSYINGAVLPVDGGMTAQNT